MKQNNIHSSLIPLPDYAANLATLIQTNTDRFSEKPIYQEVKNGTYEPLIWRDFYSHVLSIQSWLKANDFKRGDRMAILSRNCQEILELELAVMAMGAVSVPIFFRISTG